MTQERDEDGRLIYSTRSNAGLAWSSKFPGPQRAQRHAPSGGGLVKAHPTDTTSQHQRDNSGHNSPGGRSR